MGVKEIDAALARLDAPDREHVPAQPRSPAGAPGHGFGRVTRGRREPGGLNPVRDDNRLVSPTFVNLLCDRCRHTDPRIGFDDRLFVACRENRGGELVEMVNGADTATDRVRADAVLRVHDIGCVTVEFGPQHLDRPHDPVGDGVAVAIGEAGQTNRDSRIHRSKEPRIATPGQ